MTRFYVFEPSRNNCAALFNFPRPRTKTSPLIVFQNVRTKSPHQLHRHLTHTHTPNARRFRRTIKTFLTRERFAIRNGSCCLRIALERVEGAPIIMQIILIVHSARWDNLLIKENRPKDKRRQRLEAPRNDSSWWLKFFVPATETRGFVYS